MSGILAGRGFNIGEFIDERLVSPERMPRSVYGLAALHLERSEYAAASSLSISCFSLLSRGRPLLLMSPDSLVVCQTEIRDLSRMSIVLKGQDAVIEQARRQLEDLVPVWAVLDYTNTSVIERELLLAKVSILGPEVAQSQLAPPPAEEVHDGLMAREEQLVRTFEAEGHLPAGVSGAALYSSRRHITQSEALIAKNLHLGAVKTLADQFGGRVVDVAEESVIVELTAKSTRVEAFLGLIRPFGVLEAARSGKSTVV